MNSLASELMIKLYGRNIWTEYEQGLRSPDIQGWNGDHPSLSRLVTLNGPKIVVDVGVWKGLSTITLAKAMKDRSIDGVVIAVDTFLGSPEHWSSSRVLFERRYGLPDLYERFLTNVIAAGVQDYIVPLPQTSTTAASVLRRFGIRPSLVHVDAAHEYREVLNDIEDYWSLLEVGGYMIGDDYHETWPGIIRAAGEFSAKTERPLVIEAPKWILQKSK